MAPAALATPIASVSPHSAGRAAAASLAGGRRSGRTAFLPALRAGIFTAALSSISTFFPRVNSLIAQRNLALYVAAALQTSEGKTLMQTNGQPWPVRRQRRRFAVGSSLDDSKPTEEKTPFGYTRKDVLLIGLGVTLFAVGLKYGLELVGVDPLQAGNVVQLVIVLGMTVGWISTYMFRVANKDMTYAQQLRDYEKQVMEKRLESLSEAELQALLEQVEEEKQRLEPVRDQGIIFNRKMDGSE